jgi:ubiquinone/menaquinone biosynthesis C-methylase UbiE
MHVLKFFEKPLARIGSIAAVVCIVLWFSRDNGHILRFGISLLLFGISLYFLLEMYYNPLAIRKVNNFFAYPILLTERFSLPKKVRREIIRLIGPLKNKTILEFGCSVGTLTMELANQVKPKGKLYATDISEQDIGITQKRLDKKGHSHVKLIHDILHHSRVHPKVPHVHAVVSVGVLGYLQDVRKVLSDINKRLDNGGEICFLDYDKFFDIIRNKDWLSKDDRIIKLFNESGFSVKIKRVQGFAWNYIYIYGKKVRKL